MNRLWNLLRELAWLAIASVALAVVTIALAVVGGELSSVVGFGLASTALAVLNTRT